jgi:hypothetical protein
MKEKNKDLEEFRKALNEILDNYRFTKNKGWIKIEKEVLKHG